MMDMPALFPAFAVNRDSSNTQHTVAIHRCQALATFLKNAQHAIGLGLCAVVDTERLADCIWVYGEEVSENTPEGTMLPPTLDIQDLQVKAGKGPDQLILDIRYDHQGVSYRSGVIDAQRLTEPQNSPATFFADELYTLMAALSVYCAMGPSTLRSANSDLDSVATGVYAVPAMSEDGIRQLMRKVARMTDADGVHLRQAALAVAAKPWPMTEKRAFSEH